MENNNYILDSNVFIGAFFEGDSLHEVSLKIFNEIQNEKIIVPYCIIQEVCSIFSNRFSKDKADQFLNFLLNTDNFIIINNDVWDEVNFFLKFKDKISFTDLSLLLIAEKYGAKLITFDKQLLKLYSKD